MLTVTNCQGDNRGKEVRGERKQRRKGRWLFVKKHTMKLECAENINGIAVRSKGTQVKFFYKNERWLFKSFHKKQSQTSSNNEWLETLANAKAF